MAKIVELDLEMNGTFGRLCAKIHSAAEDYAENSNFASIMVSSRFTCKIKIF